jgi:hypothetical protein
MKIALIFLLHFLLLSTAFIGLVGSSSDYLVLILVQLAICVIVIAGFVYFVKTSPSIKVRIYLMAMSTVGIFFFLDGVARLFFNTRLLDYII